MINTTKIQKLDILRFKGHLYRDLHFKLHRCYTTKVVRDWPKIENSEFFIESKDKKNKTLNREPVKVWTPHHDDIYTKYQHVDGYIALKKSSAKLLLFKNDIMIDSFLIPPRPKLSISWSHKKTSRKKYFLQSIFSTPTPNSYIQIIYQWNTRRYQVLFTGKPKNKIPIDFQRLPGGNKCRFIVMYSNGLRSVVAATKFFIVPKMPPKIDIIKPSKTTIYPYEHPIDLHGSIIDLENPKKLDQLIWKLDGKLVGTGPIAGIFPVSEGRHIISLHYKDNKKIEKKRVIMIKKPKKSKIFTNN